jgi:hypothetical protein
MPEETSTDRKPAGEIFAARLEELSARNRDSWENYLYWARKKIHIELNGAAFSADRKYRYALWRTALLGDGILNFIMLNPSTADEKDNDPTVARCWRRAKALGFKKLIVTNIFPLCSTDPTNLYADPDPISPWAELHNYAYILELASMAKTVVCAWGSHGTFRNRGAIVEDLLRANSIKIHMLRLCQSGQPGHPLYLPYKEEFKVW